MANTGPKITGQCPGCGKQGALVTSQIFPESYCIQCYRRRYMSNYRRPRNYRRHSSEPRWSQEQTAFCPEELDDGSSDPYFEDPRHWHRYLINKYNMGEKPRR